MFPFIGGANLSNKTPTAIPCHVLSPERFSLPRQKANDETAILENNRTQQDRSQVYIYCNAQIELVHGQNDGEQGIEGQ